MTRFMILLTLVGTPAFAQVQPFDSNSDFELPIVIGLGCPPWCVDEELPPEVMNVVRPLSSMMMLGAMLQGAEANEADTDALEQGLGVKYDTLRDIAKLPEMAATTCPPHCFPKDSAEAHVELNAQAWSIIQHISQDAGFLEQPGFADEVEAMQGTIELLKGKR
ncbi:hypothetical protein JSE7799_01479 [Jannaschia seosinensis]|uniref:Uncharacterized protein n=1 Tax=Jannaschia seosinensis TaxID=313367 RepID=A0A0M7B991_9RHOB|nr:hypothetical protein [Jannaschia seosinensis]CUH38740.1 hypothetical protein JSE7799_01479 [Jannaschia seosinensis]